jgi:hypothetical protein
MKHTIQLAQQQNKLPLANPTSLPELELEVDALIFLRKTFSL